MNVMVNINGKQAVIVVSETAMRNDFRALYPQLDLTKGLHEILIDMRNLHYIKSEQITEIVAIKKWANTKKIAVVLLNVNDSVFQTLDTSNILSLFTIKQDYGRYTISELIEMFTDPEMAEDASEYLAKNYNLQVKEELLENIAIDDATVQSYCILTIGRAYDSSLVDIVRASLDSPYTAVVYSAILVLGWLGELQSKERLYEFICSSSYEIAEAAGTSIALLNDDSDAPRLGMLSKADDPSVRSIVAITLSLINGDIAFNLLMKMLENESEPSVRKVIARRISFFDKPEATEVLIKLLDDQSMFVQEAAASGLERAGLRGHDKEVLKKVTSSNNWVGYFAVKALGHKISEQVAQHLMEVYSSLHGNIKLAAIEALGYSMHPNVAKFLLERMDDENEDIRKESLSALYLVCNSEAAKVSESTIFTDSSWLVRYRAVEILTAEKPAGYKDVLRKVRDTDENRYLKEKISNILDNVDNA